MLKNIPGWTAKQATKVTTMRFSPLREAAAYWKSLVIILVPILLSPVPIMFAHTDEARAVKCAYVVAVMAFYWIFEVVPLSVTALLPVFAFPMLSVLPAVETCQNYLSASNFLFVGGLIIAIAVEEVNLHKRIALRVLLLMGTDPKAILFGFMITTWFLSMWMSDTATTATMIPIALAVINEIVSYHRSQRAREGVEGDLKELSQVRPIDIYATDTIRMEAQDREDQAPVDERTPTDNLEDWHKNDLNMAKAILICLCYSANIGGTSTLTGTVPNVVAQGQLQENRIQDVTYVTWMVSQTPFALILLVVAFVWLTISYFPAKTWCTFGSKWNKGLDKVLKRHYDDMGPMAFGEYVVSSMYILLVFLWIFRDPKFIKGWEEPFEEGYLKDCVPAVLVAVILFMLPRERPDFYCWRRDKSAKPKIREPIMTWDAMKRFPWHVILLLGGGFAMAAGVKESGLSDLLAHLLNDNLAGSVTPLTFQVTIVIFISFFTEITSNTSTANIFIPILISTANAMAIHPVYFVLPVAVSCSFAFMLPVATPPNAIVFGAGIIRIGDMMRTGFILKLLGVGLAVINANTLMTAVFDLEQYGNATVLATTSVAPY